MSKFKLSEKAKSSKAVVSFRNKKGTGMSKVAIAKATQPQLARLHELKHPSVLEEKAEAKKP